MKNDMERGQSIPDNYQLAGRWLLHLKGWTLVVLLVIGAAIFGLTIVLGLTIRGLLRGYLEGPANLGESFLPLVLGVFVAFIILHEGVHGLVFLV
ncbi:MAG: hypothetical protein IMY84_05750, partial [Chloroflexi bacterium]|nr:hypothetical protein [Chloroflexota bacterium]